MDGQIQVKRIYKKGKIIKREENESEVIFVTDTSNRKGIVGREVGETINLGNFESIKIGLSMTLPCHIEEVEDADEVIVTMLQEKLTKEVEDIKKARDRPNY